MKYQVNILTKARDFIQSLDEKTRAKTAAAIITLSQGDFLSVEVKLLRGPIKELKIASYRLIFFVRKKALWFVSGFRKKTRKTPPHEIEQAQRAFNILDHGK